MGLLDDAIREHLELKRRTGADPGEIARKEQEALAPVFPDEDAAPIDGAEPLAGEELQPQAEPPPMHEHEPAAPSLAAPETPDFANVGQETAELDMQAVLDEEPSPALQEQDSLEWEMPGESHRNRDAAGGEHDDPREPPEQVPGQERMSFE